MSSGPALPPPDKAKWREPPGAGSQRPRTAPRSCEQGVRSLHMSYRPHPGELEQPTTRSGQVHPDGRGTSVVRAPVPVAHHGRVSEHQHAVPRTTHTLNLEQVAEINALLAGPGTTLLAGDVGLEPAGARVAEVEMEGSPTFGYLYARLAGAPTDRVELHTDHLRAISKALHLPHHWGL